MNLRSGRQALRAHWQRWPVSSRRLLAGTLLVILVAVLAWTSLWPAWRLLQALPQQQRQLEARWTRMQWLSEQAQLLRTLPRSTADEARQALLRATREQLGSQAQVQVNSHQAVVTLTGIRPERLELWLAQIRTQARVLPSEARLERNAQGGWDGRVTFGLPTP